MAVVWDSDYAAQLAIMKQISGRLNTLENASIPATYVSLTAPTQVDINAAWGGAAPAYGKTQWFDPTLDQIRNLYFQQNLTEADPVQEPYDELNEVIDEFTVKRGDTGVSFWENTPFTKDYKSVIYIGYVRSDNVGIGRLLDVRFNNDATAIYYSALHNNTDAPAYASDGFNPTTVLRLSAAVTTDEATTPQGLYTFFTLEIFHPYMENSSKAAICNIVSSQRNFGTAGDYRSRWGGVTWRSTAPITYCRFFLNSGNFAPGSRILVLGTNPAIA